MPGSHERAARRVTTPVNMVGDTTLGPAPLALVDYVVPGLIQLCTGFFAAAVVLFRRRTAS